MNNQELELRVKELLEIENFFDMIIAVKEFEKDYKGSDFYKTTKMPLMEVIKNSKMWYLISLNSLTHKLQTMLNNLDFERVNQILNQYGEVFADQTADMVTLTQSLSDLILKE